MANRNLPSSLHRQAADLVAAIAPVSGPLMNGTANTWRSDPFDCAPGRPLPTLHIHGLADLVVPFGGNRLLGFPPVDDSVAGWRARNGCAQATPSTSFVNGSVAWEWYCF